MSSNKINQSRYQRVERGRKVNVKDERIYFLIVCEGERTEPGYFEELSKQLPIGSVSVNIQGVGMNTLSLVEQTIKLKDNGNRKYDRAWAVFDKDSFPDRNFNAAILKGEAQNVNCAWTNEAFELWFILHFQYRNTSMSRVDYKGVIENEIRNRTGDKSYTYAKNDKNTYALVSKHGSQQDAINNAERLQSLYSDKTYANHNPCTFVSELVKELTNRAYLDEKMKADKK